MQMPRHWSAARGEAWMQELGFEAAREAALGTGWENLRVRELVAWTDLCAFSLLCRTDCSCAFLFIFIYPFTRALKLGLTLCLFGAWGSVWATVLKMKALSRIQQAVPLYPRGSCQDPQWVLETTDSTQLCIHYAFFYVYIPTVKFNL